MRQNTKVNLIAISIILVWTTLIYSNTFNNSFHYDDERVIFHNTAIRNLSNYINYANLFEFHHQIGSRPVLDLTFAINYHFNKFDVFGYHFANLLIHISVCALVYFISRRIFSSANTCQRNGIDDKSNVLLPIFSTLLFATHPINSETVNYISARSTSLCALLTLISLYLFMKFMDMGFTKRLRNKETDNIRNPVETDERYSFDILSVSIYAALSILCLGGSLASFLLALGVREMAIVTPIILICFDYYFYNDKITFISAGNDKNNNKTRLNAVLIYLQKAKSVIRKFRLYHIPYWAIIILGFIKLSKTSNLSLYVPLHVNIITACKAYVYYMRLLFCPTGLSIDHYFPVAASFYHIFSIISICIVIILMALAVYTYRKLRMISFSIILYFVAPLATSSVLIISYSSATSTIAEHRIYLSSIGFCIAASVLINFISRCIMRRRDRGAASYNPQPATRNPQLLQCALIFPVLFFYSIATFNRNSDWKDEFTLWSKAVEYYPESSKAQYNLGQEYTKKGDWDESIFHYIEALKQDYNDFQTHNNLGIAYKEKGALDMAINEFKTSILLKENYAEAHFNLAIALEQKGDTDTAINEYNQSLRLKPDNIIAMYNLGSIIMERGDLDSAEFMFNKALQTAETSSFDKIEMFDMYYKSTLNEVISKNKATVTLKSLNNIGAVYIRKGNIEGAIEMFKKALQINSKDASVHYNLGCANYKKGVIDAAEMEFKTALELDTNIAEAHNYLGIIYNQRKDYDKAYNAFKTAVELRPNYAIAHKNLGLIYLNYEDVENAIFHLNETLRLSPFQENADNIKILLNNLGK